MANLCDGQAILTRALHPGGRATGRATAPTARNLQLRGGNPPPPSIQRSFGEREVNLESLGLESVTNGSDWTIVGRLFRDL